jgi:hypothetical protein
MSDGAGAATAGFLYVGKDKVAPDNVRIQRKAEGSLD